MKHRNRDYQRCAVSDRRPVELVATFTEAELLDAILLMKNHPYEWAWKERGELSFKELTRRFRVRNEIGPSLFKSPHWQTLFNIEFPGVGDGLVK